MATEADLLRQMVAMVVMVESGYSDRMSSGCWAILRSCTKMLLTCLVPSDLSALPASRGGGGGGASGPGGASDMLPARACTASGPARGKKQVRCLQQQPERPAEVTSTIAWRRFAFTKCDPSSRTAGFRSGWVDPTRN